MKLRTYSPYIVLSHYTAYYGIPVTKLNHLTFLEDIHYSPYHTHLTHNILFPHQYMLPCHTRPMSPKSEQLRNE